MKLATKIEAILYIKGRPLSLEEIGTLLECEREIVEEGLIELMNDYAHRDSALEIVEISLCKDTAGSWKPRTDGWEIRRWTS